jgi:hypothetical protein
VVLLWEASLQAHYGQEAAWAPFGPGGLGRSHMGGYIYPGQVEAGVTLPIPGWAEEKLTLLPLSCCLEEHSGQAIPACHHTWNFTYLHAAAWRPANGRCGVGSACTACYLCHCRAPGCCQPPSVGVTYYCLGSQAGVGSVLSSREYLTATGRFPRSCGQCRVTRGRCCCLLVMTCC